jgi:hypothetical protein
MRFTMILNESEAKALQHVSVIEDRHPRDQARRALREWLRQAGALDPVDPKTAPAPEPASAVPA